MRDVLCRVQWVCVVRSRPRCQCHSPTACIASMTGIASPDDWQGARNLACAEPVAVNTPVAVYGNKRLNSGRLESAADRPSHALRPSIKFFPKAGRFIRSPRVHVAPRLAARCQSHQYR